MNEFLSHWLSNKILTTNLKKSPTPSFIVLWIPKAKNQTEFRSKMNFSYNHHLKKIMFEKTFFCYIFLIYQTLFAYLVPNSSPSLVLWSYNFKKHFWIKIAYLYTAFSGGVQTIYDSTQEYIIFHLKYRFC